MKQTQVRRRKSEIRNPKSEFVIRALAFGLAFSLGLPACRKPKPPTQSKIQNPKPKILSTLGDTFNILLTGRDARLVGDASQDGIRRNRRENDYHSDVIIIAHVNMTLPRVTLFNIPRDMLVDIPGYSKPEDRLDFTNMDKITHATAYGQEPLLIKTIARNLGVRIQRRMALDFDSFRLMFALLKPFLGKLTFGERQLNTPDSALMFVRDRHHYANDDLDRSRHSVLFVKTVVQRLWRRLDSRFMSWLLPRMFGLLGADTDLSDDDIQYLLTALRQHKFNPDSIETAVMIGEEGPVTLWKYAQTLSCCLPAYDEDARQVAYYLKDQLNQPAFSFMEQNQKIRWPGYDFENYDLLVSETAHVDTLNPVFRRLQLEKDSLTVRRDSLRRDSLKSSSPTPNTQHPTPDTSLIKPKSAGATKTPTPNTQHPDTAKPAKPSPQKPKPKGK